MPARRLEIDDRLLAVPREVADDGIAPRHRPIGAPGKRAHAERIGVAAQHARGLDDVLDRSPSITAPGSVSSAQLPFPGSSTTAWPPWRNIAVSKLVRVRRLGSMNTMAKHLPLEAAADLPALDPSREPEQPLDLRVVPVLQGEKVALGHASTSLSPARRRSASSAENESGRQETEHVRDPTRYRSGCDGRRARAAPSAAGRSRCRPSSSPRPLTRGDAQGPRAAREVIADPHGVRRSAPPARSPRCWRARRRRRPGRRRTCCRGRRSRDAAVTRGRRDHRADRQTRGEPLGEGEDVGRHPDTPRRR